MKTTPYPRWVFEAWASGNGDLYCATDKDLPMHPLRRWTWRIRGNIMTTLFSWWWWI